MSTKVSSPAWSEDPVGVSEKQPREVVDQPLHVRWRPRCRRPPQSAVTQDLLHHLALRRVDKGDYLRLAEADAPGSSAMKPAEYPTVVTSPDSPSSGQPEVHRAPRTN